MPEPTTVPFSFAAEILRKRPDLARKVEEVQARREGRLTAEPDFAISPPVSPQEAAGRLRARERIQRQGFAPPETGIPAMEGTGEAEFPGRAEKLIKAIDFFQKTVQDPLIGGAQFNFAKIIPGEQFYEKRVPELLAEGMSGHDALGQARREFADENQPWWLTLTQDLVVDPLNVLPVVGFTKLPAATSKLPVLASRALAGEVGGIRASRVTKVWQVKTGINGPMHTLTNEQGQILGHYRTVQEAKKAADAANAELKWLEATFKPKSPPVPPEEKLLQQVALSKGRRSELNAAQFEERTKRIAAATDALNNNTGEAAWQKAMGELKGELTDIRLQPLDELMSIDDLNGLRETIRAFDTPLLFNRVDARAALDDLWIGKIPQPAQLRELENIFPGVAASVKKADPLKYGALALEILNVPRTLKTAFDMSAALRQGVFFLPGHPKEWADSFGRMIKAFGSEDIARASEEAIASHPYKGLADNSKLSITSRFGGLAGREEAYMSRLLQQIPILGEFIKASERAYVTFLNKLRMDVFATLADQLLSKGKTFAQNPDDFQKLAEFINRATGRGGFGPQIIEQAAPILNTLLFSPRNLTGQILLPISAIKTTPMVRWMVLRDMAAFFGTGSLLMTLLHFSGVDIIRDPRSADFGKIRSGATRLDIWGGKQPLARFLARFVLKKGKSTSSGELYDLGRDEVLWQFIRSKFSPSVGIGVDVLTEETFLGERLEPTVGSAGQIARSGLLPLIVDDLWEAFDEQGIGGVATASPSFFGVGAVSFTTMRDIQNRRSAELYDGKEYLQLDNLDQKKAVNADPEVQAKLAEIKENQEVLDARSMMSDRMARRDTVQTDHELTLAKSLKAPGKAKRLHIANYKSTMYTVNQTLLEDPQLQAVFEAREAEQTTRDYVRSLYWSAPLVWDGDAVQPDYDALDAAHQDTLGLADLLGVSRDYILRRSPDRFNDARVEAMVVDYETDQQLLRRYWNLDDRAMNMLGLSPRQRSAWRAERTLPLPQQSPATRAVGKLYSRLKEHMFITDTEVRDLLIKWQYRQDPLTTGR